MMNLELRPTRGRGTVPGENEYKNRNGCRDEPLERQQGRDARIAPFSLSPSPRRRKRHGPAVKQAFVDARIAEGADYIKVVYDHAFPT
jgi:hypothetical protein